MESFFFLRSDFLQPLGYGVHLEISYYFFLSGVSYLKQKEKKRKKFEEEEDQAGASWHRCPAHPAHTLHVPSTRVLHCEPYHTPRVLHHCPAGAARFLCVLPTPSLYPRRAPARPALPCAAVGCWPTAAGLRWPRTVGFPSPHLSSIF